MSGDARPVWLRLGRRRFLQTFRGFDPTAGCDPAAMAFRQRLGTRRCQSALRLPVAQSGGALGARPCGQQDHRPVCGGAAPVPLQPSEPSSAAARHGPCARPDLRIEDGLAREPSGGSGGPRQAHRVARGRRCSPALCHAGRRASSATARDRKGSGTLLVVLFAPVLGAAGTCCCGST